MPTLSATQIAGYARGAGLTDSAAVATATAIALAESGGRTDAVGDLTLVTATWGPSVGLWQIRSVVTERGRRTSRDYDALFDPAHNARAMVEISSGGTNWTPWSVYKSGVYSKYAQAAQGAAGAPPLSSAAGGAQLDPTGSLGRLAGFFEGSNGLFMRVLLGAAGLGLITVGANIVFRDLYTEAAGAVPQVQATRALLTKGK